MKGHFRDLIRQKIVDALAAPRAAVVCRGVGVLATGSERRRMVNPRDVYPIDPALI